MNPQSLISIALLVFQAGGGVFGLQKALLKHLFADYNKELRPVKGVDPGPTNVTVQLYFKQIQKVEESDQILTLYCWIEEYWTDEFLTWNPSQFGGIKSLHVPADLIWKPDLLVYNSANMNVRENEMQTNVEIKHDGRISLFRAVITDITCDMDMQRFPFDQQICFIMLASWSYDGSQIMLQMSEELDESPPSNRSTFTALSHYIPNMEWKLVDFKYRTNLKMYECCSSPYPDISYFFSIKRNPSYYLFTLIVPSAFITIVTVVGFFTPHSSTGENAEKVTLGVTALLSLAIIPLIFSVMMVSDKLPATSNAIPLLGKYYIGLILIMFCATYCTTWTLYIQMQGNAGKSIPQRARNFLLSYRLSRNVFVRWFFGRELSNTQQSIRMRMRKFDKLNALKSDANRSVIGIHQLLLNVNNGSIENNTHMAHATTTTTNAARETNQSSSLNFLSSDSFGVHALIEEIFADVRAIRCDLIGREHLRRVRKEWQMLARMIEKLLMIIFSVFTISFAAVMLYDEQDPPMITEQFMNDKGKA